MRHTMDRLPPISVKRTFGSTATPGKPTGVSKATIEDQLEVGRRFAANEADTRRVVATTFYEPTRFKFHSSVPQSNAFVGRVELLGSIRPGRVTYEDQGRSAIVEPAEGDFKELGGRTYWELPNSTSVAVGDEELVITRGIRPYKNRITPSEGLFNGPDNYVSDLLLFRRNDAGELEFVHRLLDSAPEERFFFEDPRISVVEDNGTRRIFLSGTDYSPHVPGDSACYVRNAYLELQVDPATNLIEPIAVDPRTKKPAFRYLSPMPVSTADGSVGIDAKNATIAQREDGKIVVRTRFRPDFEQDPVVQRYKERYGDRVPSWSYGVQTFVFDDLEHLAGYDWRNALDLLLANHLDVPPMSPRRDKDPSSAKLVMTEASLVDFYPRELYVPGKPIGLGPGTRPIRVERQGDQLYVSDGPNAPKLPAGKASGDFLTEGDVVYVSFDHKLRYLAVKDPDDPEKSIARKRVYTGTITVWEKDLETVRTLYDDVVQPVEDHQIGLTGIMDLHHAAYNMGVVLLPDPSGEEATVRVTAGEADAHTATYDWDLSKLFMEIPERRSIGQAYLPA